MHGGGRGAGGGWAVGSEDLARVGLQARNRSSRYRRLPAPARRFSFGTAAGFDGESRVKPDSIHHFPRKYMHAMTQSPRLRNLRPASLFNSRPHRRCRLDARRPTPVAFLPLDARIPTPLPLTARCPHRPKEKVRLLSCFRFRKCQSRVWTNLKLAYTRIRLCARTHLLAGWSR